MCLFFARGTEPWYHVSLLGVLARADITVRVYIDKISAFIISLAVLTEDQMRCLAWRRGMLLPMVPVLVLSPTLTTTRGFLYYQICDVNVISMFTACVCANN